MKDFRPTERPLAHDWPRWVCSAIDPECGHSCELVATWSKPWLSDGTYIRAYCDRHRPEGATPIQADGRYLVTRIELRVAIASLPGDLEASAEQNVRAAVNALERAGGVVVGVHVRGGKASADALDAPPLRLALAGKPEPAVRADRPFWGVPETPAWQRAQRGRKTG